MNIPGRSAQCALWQLSSRNGEDSGNNGTATDGRTVARGLMVATKFIQWFCYSACWLTCSPTLEPICFTKSDLIQRSNQVGNLFEYLINLNIRSFLVAKFSCRQLKKSKKLYFKDLKTILSLEPCQEHNIKNVSISILVFLRGKAILELWVTTFLPD